MGNIVQGDVRVAGVVWGDCDAAFQATWEVSVDNHWVYMERLVQLRKKLNWGRLQTSPVLFT